MKKFWIIFFIIAIPLGIVGGLFVDNLQKKKVDTLQKIKDIVQKKLPSESTKEYKDPSGFSFEIPDDVEESASGDLDSSTYANIQLSSKMVVGNIIFKVSDTKFKFIDEWLEKNDATKSGVVKDVKLGDLSSKEVEKYEIVKTAAIDQSILFELSMEPENETDYWNTVYKKILETFQFVNPQVTQSSSSGGTAESDVIYEGEEVVE